MSSSPSNDEENDHMAAVNALRHLSVGSEKQSVEYKENNSNDPISEKYFKAQKLHAKIKSGKLDPRSDTYEEVMKTTQSLFMSVYKAVKQSDLFSSNEEVDDINTVDLKYLLVPFYLGDLCLSSSDPEKRLANVNLGTAYLKSFLSSCIEYKLMEQDDIESFNRGNAPVKADVTRKEKISRFKRKQEVTDQLEQLLEVRERQRKEKGNKFDDDNAEEEEGERKILLLSLSLSITDALESLRYAEEEKGILAHMDKLRKEGKLPPIGSNRPPPRQDPRTAPPPNVYHMSSRGSPMQEINVRTGERKQATNLGTNLTDINSIIEQKANVQAQVFREANAPTMTLDDWVDGQIRQGLMPDPAASGHGPSMVTVDRSRVGQGHFDAEPPNSDDEEEDESEEATLKAREWDNWKDDNEKGAGNKKIR